MLKNFSFKKIRGKVNALLWEVSCEKGKNPKGKSSLMIGHSQERQKSTAESSIRTSKQQMLAMKGICPGPSNLALQQKIHDDRNFLGSLS